jgi:multidrug transporter EmrE-like cation transporter
MAIAEISTTRFVLDVLLVTLLEYVGDSSLKVYARNGSNTHLFIGLIAYAIVMYFLIQILKYANVMQMNISWDAVSVIVETALAYYLLHETLSGVTQYVGFIMIILGMVFMGIGKQAYK